MATIAPTKKPPSLCPSCQSILTISYNTTTTTSSSTSTSPISSIIS